MKTELASMTGLYSPNLRKGRGPCRRPSVGAASQIRFDGDLGAATEPRAVDLHIFHEALDVVACLGDRDALGPVDRVDIGIARIAVSGEPLPYAPHAGVIASKSQQVRAAVVVQQVG